MEVKTNHTLLNKINNLKRYRMRATPGNICFLGITSIGASWMFGIFGILISRYALKLHKRAKSGNNENEARLKKGRIYAITGMVLSSIILFATVLVFFLSLIS
jgi:hypothetical protein